MNISPSLPLNVWRVLHAMLMEDAVPRRAQFEAIAQFEQALRAASEPPAEADAPAE